MDARIRVLPSAGLTAAEWSTLTELCVAAFNEPWDDYWENIGPGVHVLAEDIQRGIVAHAAMPIAPPRLRIRLNNPEACLSRAGASPPRVRVTAGGTASC